MSQKQTDKRREGDPPSAIKDFPATLPTGQRIGSVL
mgnify:CR=1